MSDEYAESDCLEVLGIAKMRHGYARRAADGDLDALQDALDRELGTSPSNGTEGDLARAAAIEMFYVSPSLRAIMLAGIEHVDERIRHAYGSRNADEIRAIDEALRDE